MTIPCRRELSLSLSLSAVWPPQVQPLPPCPCLSFSLSPSASRLSACMHEEPVCLLVCSPAGLRACQPTCLPACITLSPVGVLAQLVQDRQRESGRLARTRFRTPEHVLPLQNLTQKTHVRKRGRGGPSEVGIKYVGYWGLCHTRGTKINFSASSTASMQRRVYNLMWYVLILGSDIEKTQNTSLLLRYFHRRRRYSSGHTPDDWLLKDLLPPYAPLDRDSKWAYIRETACYISSTLLH